MESSILLNLERSYLSVKEDFKKVIKDDDELKNQLFETETSSKARKVLSSNHLKPLTHMKGAKPEAVTTQHILKLFNEIGIPQELIIPEVRLKIINGFRGKPINRYPDLAITNQSFKKDLKKNLLFEIEALNKDLTTENDGEGIEQALKWYHQSIGLYRDYNAIITNFNEWYLLKFNKKDEPVIKKKKPLEILELIYETTLGHGTEYFEDEEGEEISKNFYAEFSKRLKMLINPTNNNIKILGIRDSSNLIVTGLLKKGILVIYLQKITTKC